MTVRAYITVLLCLLFLGAGVTGVLSYRHMANRIAGLEAQATELTALKASVSALGKEAATRAVSDNQIRTNRAATERAVESAANETPAVADYLHERIPDGLRKAHLDSRTVPPAVPH